MKTTRTLTIVIKLGTSSICDEKTHEPLISNLSLIVETCVRLRRDGHRVILVSSGAIGIGLRRLDIEHKPKQLSAKQAIAAVGQCRLIALWDELFKQLRQPVAQILLTRSDIAERTQYLNAVNTFDELLHMGVIPIVNENDTLAVSEIKFGDNDTLSAITAGMVHADYLFLMTDVDCLYTNNPRTHPDAKPIEVVDDINALTVDVSSAGSSVGTGGMATKLIAARLATSAGVTTIITRASTPSNIFHIVKYIQRTQVTPSSSSGTTTPYHSPISTDDPVALSSMVAATKLHTPRPGTPASNQPYLATAALPKNIPYCPLHTRFLPQGRAIRDRYFWILHGLKPQGTIYVDEGAYKALTRHDKAGLLPVGVVAVEGTFTRQEPVSLAIARKGATPDEWEPLGGGDLLGGELGRALVNYSSGEIARIKGKKSSDIALILGYSDTEYIADRDNTAFFPDRTKSAADLKVLIAAAEEAEKAAEAAMQAHKNNNVSFFILFSPRLRLRILVGMIFPRY